MRRRGVGLLEAEETKMPVSTYLDTDHRHPVAVGAVDRNTLSARNIDNLTFTLGIPMSSFTSQWQEAAFAVEVAT